MRCVRSNQQTRAHPTNAGEIVGYKSGTPEFPLAWSTVEAHSPEGLRADNAASPAPARPPGQSIVGPERRRRLADPRDLAPVAGARGCPLVVGISSGTGVRRCVSD